MGFYPSDADGTNSFAPIKFHSDNRKGFETTRAAINLCLSKLQLEYVDLLLIHNPLTDLVEYAASATPHAFELAKSILTPEDRALVFASRLSKVIYNEEKGEAFRADTWRALEEAQIAGKTRFIGVSNYTTRQCAAMSSYAKVMPALNQLELHPRASAPNLRTTAKLAGMVVTAYGSGTSVAIEKSQVIASIASRRNESPNSIVLRWTLQSGVVVIPRTANVDYMKANLETATGGEPLCDFDMKSIEEMNQAHLVVFTLLSTWGKGRCQLIYILRMTKGRCEATVDSLLTVEYTRVLKVAMHS